MANQSILAGYEYMRQGRKKKKENLHFQDSKPDDSLAQVTTAAALFCRVKGSLAGKRGQPKDGKDGVDEEHGVGLGETTGPLPARRANEVDPRRHRQEALWRSAGVCR